MADKPEGNSPPSKDTKDTPQRPRMSTSTLWILLVLALVFALITMNWGAGKESEISYGRLLEQLEGDNVAKLRIRDREAHGEFVDPPDDPKGKQGADGKSARLKSKFFTILPPNWVEDAELSQLLKKLGADYSADLPRDNTATLLVVYLLVPVLLFAGIWYMFRRTRDQVLGGGMLAGFTKSPAKQYETGDAPVTFDDVAGLDTTKRELEEIVEFLKNPEKFQRLGGRVPKGVLLMGAPGTGKTLLGRAVAGEADVPFFSISGSEFIQMFVGVGAGRVRDMFATAKANAPSILFIDEIDAVGRHRGAGLGGGHDEREQTLNQILSEMDGFTQNQSVIVVAATNRPDILDPALLRPGRFDRHITVDRPNLKGRLAIFKVHVRGVPLADDVDFQRLASGSVGLTGADIRNLVNEAALWATRQEKDNVEMSDFEHARDKVLMGPKREDVLAGRDKLVTAYHEAGHAVMAWLTPGIDRVHQVSIIPRGRSLGATQLLPEEDRLNIGESELHARLLTLLGGRSAEKLVFNEFSAGGEDDLKTATRLARNMVTHWGMSDRLGPVAFRAGEEHPFLGKEMAEPREFSEHTARVIDEEIVRILRQAADKARQTLSQHRDKLDKLAAALDQQETLGEHQIEELIGPPAYQKTESADRPADTHKPAKKDQPTDSDGPTKGKTAPAEQPTRED